MTIEQRTTSGRTLRNDRDLVSTAVVEAVAEESGVDPTAMPPLYERVDPDALDALFAPTAVGSPRSGAVGFTYAGYQVEIARDGEIELSLNERAVR